MRHLFRVFNRSSLLIFFALCIFLSSLFSPVYISIYPHTREFSSFLYFFLLGFLCVLAFILSLKFHDIERVYIRVSDSNREKSSIGSPRLVKELNTQFNFSLLPEFARKNLTRRLVQMESIFARVTHKSFTW